MASLQGAAAYLSGLIGRDSPIIRALRPGYESLLDCMTFGRGIQWKINGVTYRIDPHNRNRLGAEYDAPVASFLQQHVKPGAICFDVGANVGVYVLQFAHWSRPSGRVIAFEPNPDAREILLKHIRFNGLQQRVDIVASAIAAKEGQATLFKAGAEGMSRLGEPNQAIAGRVSPVTVPVTTLDAFSEKSALEPDWLLIDIEGFEIAALKGATRLIKRRKDELGVIVEMHPNAWDVAGTDRGDAESLLSQMRLRCIPLTGQRDGLAEHGLVLLSHQ
jgi:FkbM family methyltransferase